MKEFPMMKGAESDEGDIAPIRKEEERLRYAGNCLSQRASFLLGFYVVYDLSSLCRGRFGIHLLYLLMFLTFR